MSDTSQGQGWWQASDLKWYPPEAHPDRAALVQPGPAAVQWQPNEPVPDPGTAHQPKHALTEADEIDDDKPFDARIPLLIFLILFFIAVGVSAYIISLHN